MDGSVFHSRNGWYFKRDGFDVVILRGDIPEDAKELVRFGGNTWASIVTSMSAKEDAEVYQAISNLFAYGSIKTPTAI